jgi:hypothetical protein
MQGESAANARKPQDGFVTPTGWGGTATFGNISISGISATPEPSALLLLASGFIGLMLVARR